MKLNLEDILKYGEDALDELLCDIVEEYNINADIVHVDGRNEEVWCYDDDLTELFSDSGIGIGKVVHFENKFDFDEDTYEPVGLDYDDYIETVELHQNGNTYLCKAYCAHNGVGADYAFALFDIERGE